MVNNNVSIKAQIMLGCIEIHPWGSVWTPDPRLGISPSAQLANNMKIDPDFKVVRAFRPLVRFTVND